MKKILILFIIMVSLMTFAFTRDKKVDETKVVTENEIIQYKQSLVEIYSKYGVNYTEEEIDEKAQEYKKLQISIAKSKAEGMEFGEALRTSLITSAICFVVFGGLIFLRVAHYRELFR